VFHSINVRILHHFWGIVRYWSKIANMNLPHLYLAPPSGVTPSKFRRDLWGQKTKVSGLLFGVALCYIAILVQCRHVIDRHMTTAYTSLGRRCGHYHTEPSRPTSGLRCECYAWDADIIAQAGISDNNRHQSHPQHNVLIAGIATKQRCLVWLSIWRACPSLLNRVLNWPIQVT